MYVTTMQLFDYAVENASFLRLKNVSIGYTLPKYLVRKAWLENVRVYVTGYNLLTFTKYSGADPEVDTSSISLGTCLHTCTHTHTRPCPGPYNL